MYAKLTNPSWKPHSSTRTISKKCYREISQHSSYLYINNTSKTSGHEILLCINQLMIIKFEGRHFSKFPVKIHYLDLACDQN